MKPTTTYSNKDLRNEIDAYISRVSKETGMTPEQIEIDLLFDAVIRAKADYHESEEYPEVTGVKGGCGHSADELIFSSIVCAVGCGFFVLIMAAVVICAVLKYFGIIAQ